MQAYSLKRENGVTPIVGLHRIPAKKHPYGALAGVKAPSFFIKNYRLFYFLLLTYGFFMLYFDVVLKTTCCVFGRKCTHILINYLVYAYFCAK